MKLQNNQQIFVKIIQNIKNIKVDYTLCNNIIKREKFGEIIYKSNKKVKQIKV